MVQCEAAITLASAVFLMSQPYLTHLVQCLAHEPPLSAAHVARLLVQEAVAANNRLPAPLEAPAEPRDPYSDEDDREQNDDNRHAAAALSPRFICAANAEDNQRNCLRITNKAPFRWNTGSAPAPTPFRHLLVIAS